MKQEVILPIKCRFATLDEYGTIVFHDVIFLNDFGLWKKDEKLQRLWFSSADGMVAELDEHGFTIIPARSVRVRLVVS